VCEIPLPKPRFINSRDLSTISGNKEPTNRANLLNSNFLFITGNSKIINGTARWNIRKKSKTSLKIRINLEIK